MKNYSQLTLSERKQLAHYLIIGLPMSIISKKLNRHRSTIYREIERNKKQEYYCPFDAHDLSQSRCCRGDCKLRNDSALHSAVMKRLKKGWSPEIISGRLKREKKPYYVCHETIYRYIYSCKNKQLFYYLVKKKPTRGKRLGRKTGSGKYKGMRPYDSRPQEINDRNEPGHWEGDSMLFSSHRYENISTAVERQSRYLLITKHSNGKSKTVFDHIADRMLALPKKLRKTITVDQGSEFARYREVERKTRTQVYFCDAHSPWQKGSNENMNGRIRRYLPRNIDITQIDQSIVNTIANKMNNMPRKCLNFETPYEVIRRLFPSFSRTSV